MVQNSFEVFPFLRKSDEAPCVDVTRSMFMVLSDLLEGLELQIYLDRFLLQIRNG